MTDRLKPMTKAWYARQRRHRHNGFSGSARMMEMQLQAMLDSDSTSERTKFYARTILDYVGPLKTSLKQRIDSS
jgi:hypothetical protein